MQSVHPPFQRRITLSLAYTLFAIGSFFLLLSWIFFDFFAGMLIIDFFMWLPLLILLLIIALCISKQWLSTTLAIPLSLIALCSLYYLLLAIGSLPALPFFIKAITTTIILILLHTGIFWRIHTTSKTTNPKEMHKMSIPKRSSITLFIKTAASIAIGGLFLKAYIWDDSSKKWLINDLFQRTEDGHKLTLAPALQQHLNDASHLHHITVSEIRTPKTASEVIKAVNDAKSTNRKISLSGIRHSMGGQALGQNTLHLAMTSMDSVRYNPSDQTVTVGPGATWRQIQHVLSPHNRAVRVMQDSNIFTVGGSLSVNAHGKDPQYGSLIEGVNYLKIVTARGQELRCDKTTNSELFAAVIGGYGLLGIITEVNLQTTTNDTYAFSLQFTPTSSLIDRMETLSKNPKTRLMEAHLSVDPERFLTESLIYTYTKTTTTTPPKDELDGENSIWLRKVIFQASRMSDFGKSLRWELEKSLSPLVEPSTVSRNTAMAVPVRFLENPETQSTDILQEYFVPTAQATVFLATYKKLLRKHNIHLLNVTVRKAIKDTNALVSYAQEDTYGFVVYYKVQRTNTAVQSIAAFTQNLIEYLITIKATYYLCYGNDYSRTQLKSMYPTIDTLFTLKTQQDPTNLFTNLWYDTYGLPKNT